jgi:hypothetical protein
MSAEPRLLSRPTKLGDAVALGAAVGAVVLAIIALAGISPPATAPVAAICVGIALLGHGGLVTSRLFALGSPVGASDEQAEVGEAAGDEVLGGAFAIAFGILALVGFAPLLLLGVAAITAGGALVFAAPSRPRLTHVEPERAVREKRATVGRFMGRRRKRRTSEGRKRASRQHLKARVRRDAAPAHEGEAAPRATTIAARPRDDRESSNAEKVARATKATHARSRRKGRTHEPAGPPKSLNELLAELPPKPANEQDRGEPLFEPEDLAAARANPAIIAAMPSHDAAPGADELPDASAKAVHVAVDPPAIASDRAPELPPAPPQVVTPAQAAVVEPAEPPPAPPPAGLEDEVHAPASESRSDQAAVEAAVEAAVDEEREREREAIENAEELQYGLQAHLGSDALEHEPMRHEQGEHEPTEAPTSIAASAGADVRPASADVEADVQKRRELPAVEPIPMSRETIHQHPGLYLGAVAWIVGGLASVVLGIVAVAGVDHAFAVVETAVLVAGLALLVSSVGKAVDASRHAGRDKPLAHS